MKLSDILKVGEKVKKLRGYDRYYISDRGNVYSSVNKGEAFELSKIQDRYVNLCKGGQQKRFLVSYLVADLFVPNPEGFRYVVHVNGDSRDSRAANLVWSNSPGTISTLVKNGMMRPVLQMSEEGVVIAKYRSISEARRMTGINRTSISHCLMGERKLAGGYRWSYEKKMGE